jgi:membrane protein required for beta-lactamase induction
MPLFHLVPSLVTAEILTIAVAAIEAGVVIFSTRLTSLINAAAVVTEIVGVVGLTVVLLIVSLTNGKGKLSHDLTAIRDRLNPRSRAPLRHQRSPARRAGLGVTRARCGL